MMFNIKEHLVDIISKECEKSPWKNDSMFSSIKSLSIDGRGKVGEVFLRDIFQKLNKKVVYDIDKTGDYDIIIDDFKIEVKTATASREKDIDIKKGFPNEKTKFQHEGIKDNGNWDLICFIDMAPSKLYMTFIPNEKFTFNIEGIKKSKDNTIIEYIFGELNWKEISQNIHFRGKDGTDSNATGAGYKVDLKISDLIEVNKIKDIENLFNECIKVIKNI